MDFDLAPPVGVGPLQIGMPREAATAALESLRDLSSLSDSDRLGQHIVRPSGLMISIGCMQGQLEAIELGRPVASTDRVRFRGLDVFSLPAREVVRLMREYTTVQAVPEDPASFVAPDLLLSFWRPFEADEPEEEQGHYFGSVLVAKPGYYDTPAEAEERRRRLQAN